MKKKTQTSAKVFTWASRGSAVVEQSIHTLKFEGSIPRAAGAGDRKILKKLKATLFSQIHILSIYNILNIYIYTYV
jgi:hypothetical protein